MIHTLYGDGIHDDYPAIQEMIDSGVCEVSLPAPKKNYLISSTLVLPSNFRLVLPRFAEIKLADGASCLMVRNLMKPFYAERLLAEHSPLCKHLWYYVDECDPDFTVENIEICGGIWNFNNKNQMPNVEQTKDLSQHGYTGDGMLFYGVKNLKLTHMTCKDPVHWGISLDRVSYFTVEDITFDYNLGNPVALNMDGVHLNGNCHFGVLENLKGACYDDLVAINAHEGSKGPITNIHIDGIFAEVCHSAVRLLTVSDDIRNIKISNVYGTYYQYCIGFTKYYPGETTGVFDAIVLDGIHASKASREGIYPYPNSFVFPFIFIQSNTSVKNLRISNMHRDESVIPICTVGIQKNASIESLYIDGASTQNRTDSSMPFINNEGRIGDLTLSCINTDKDPLISGDGIIENLKHF